MYLSSKPICNICGGRHWTNMGARGKVMCLSCGSLERTRAIKLQIDKLISPDTGNTILHFAPERGLYEYFNKNPSYHYESVDYSPENFQGLNVKKFDILYDCEVLPSNHYDLILHSHVLEHIPCNIAYFFFHIDRALKSSGKHVFCIPILSGYYDEYFGPLKVEERIRRFGQDDHVRKFGIEDIRLSLGKIVRLPETPSHYSFASHSELDLYNIPTQCRYGFNSHTILTLNKGDYLLR